MYFVTEPPIVILFNTQTGVTIKVVDTNTEQAAGKRVYAVMMGSEKLFIGRIEACQDFIYGIAGWVGAVNPITWKRREDD